MISDVLLYDQWRFQCDRSDSLDHLSPDADWQVVQIPHTWNAYDMYPGWPHREAYVGSTWYRRQLELPPTTNGERYLLTFEGISNSSQVWLDGQYVGGRDGGFLGFRVDITDALRPTQRHTLAVRADNRFRPDSVPPTPIDWERYGGIYRPVWLLRRGASHFEYKGVSVTTPVVTANHAELCITCDIRETVLRSNPLTLRHTVRDRSGVVVATLTGALKTRVGSGNRSVLKCHINHPALWSPDSPNLYRVTSELLDDQTTLDREQNPLGFRWFRFDPNEGFSLNGKPMKLCGVNVHQDFPGLGHAGPDRFQRLDIELMKAAGMNFLRGSHYPRNERQLDACDELGILVMEEQPFWHGSLRTAGGERLLEHGETLMRDMVRHHGNHPSIIAWNTVNEVMLVLTDGEPHPEPSKRTDLHELPRVEWPYAKRGIERLVAALRKADPSRPVSMVVGGWWRRNVEAGFPDLADLLCYNGGAMHGMVDGVPVFDHLHHEHPHWVHVMSEGVLNDQAPQRADWAQEMQSWQRLATHWNRIYERPWFCGGAMWVFANYSTKGAEKQSGCVDMARLPKESYRFLQSQWATRPMVHICGHWSRADEPGDRREVVVFSNCQDVRLNLGERDLGPGIRCEDKFPALPHPPRVWQVPWEGGRLRAVGKATGSVVIDECVTEGPPAQVVLRSETLELNAGAPDVAFVTVRVLDAAGHRCYNAFGEVLLRVDGDGRLAGPVRREVRGGMAGFAVVTNGARGAVRIQAAFDRLAGASLELRIT